MPATEPPMSMLVPDCGGSRSHRPRARSACDCASRDGRLETADRRGSPINQSADLEESRPSLAAVGGVPYVARREFDGTNYELRVARLKAGSNSWEQPGDYHSSGSSRRW